MGIFSSKEPEDLWARNEVQIRRDAEIRRTIRIQQLREQELRRKREQDLLNKELLRRQQEQDLVNQLLKLSISESFQPIPVKFNAGLVNDLLQCCGASMGSQTTSTYTLTLLHTDSWEYISIQRKFRSTNKKCYNVKSIEKITNPYLLILYKLMEKTYVDRYGSTNEEELFHGTRLSNIDNICKFNFNWRLKGTARGHKFGQGVSFTPIANYATHYGDKSYDKVMIVAKVLISNKCVGNRDTVIPPLNYDTTTKEDEHVLVKYEDNTFYPAYLIHYQGSEPNYKHPKQNIYLYD